MKKEKFTVVIDYLGMTRTREISSLSIAQQIAEDAVYVYGADYSAVEHEDGSIYCEYES